MTRLIILDALLWALIFTGIGLKLPHLSTAAPAVLIMIAVSATVLSGMMWIWRSQVVEMLVLQYPKTDWLLLGWSAAGKALFLHLQGAQLLAGLWAVGAVSVYGFIAMLLIRKKREGVEI